MTAAIGVPPTPRTSGRVERFNTIVVGAGQAGLSAGYHLQQLDIDFVIVDAHDRVGDVWRNRWDSLRLFTPARYSSLPGMPFPAPPMHLAVSRLPHLLSPSPLLPLAFPRRSAAPTPPPTSRRTPDRRPIPRRAARG